MSGRIYWTGRKWTISPTEKVRFRATFEKTWSDSELSITVELGTWSPTSYVFTVEKLVDKILIPHARLVELRLKREARTLRTRRGKGAACVRLLAALAPSWSCGELCKLDRVDVLAWAAETITIPDFNPARGPLILDRPDRKGD